MVWRFDGVGAFVDLDRSTSDLVAEVVQPPSHFRVGSSFSALMQPRLAAFQRSGGGVHGLSSSAVVLPVGGHQQLLPGSAGG